MPLYDSPTSIRLPREVRDFLRACAKAEGRTLSAVVIEVLRRWQVWKKKQSK
jgi:predicted DNA-binding protein